MAMTYEQLSALTRKFLLPTTERWLTEDAEWFEKWQALVKHVPLRLPIVYAWKCPSCARSHNTTAECPSCGTNAP